MALSQNITQLAPDAQTPEHTREAVEFYLLPQFQDLPGTIKEKISAVLRRALPEYPLNLV